MPQIGFFIGGVSVGVGALGFLIAWDRFNSGPSAADDPSEQGCGIYSFFNLTWGAQLIRVKSMSPIAISEDSCPTLPDNQPDWVHHFDLKSAGTAMSAFPNLVFEIFDGSSNRIYSAAPGGSLIAQLSDGSFGMSEASFQAQMTLQPWLDPMEGSARLIGGSIPGKELWRALMTPNQPLSWFDAFSPSPPTC